MIARRGTLPPVHPPDPREEAWLTPQGHHLDRGDRVRVRAEETRYGEDPAFSGRFLYLGTDRSGQEYVAVKEDGANVRTVRPERVRRGR